MPYRTIGFSGEQLRAARALARLEQADLARLTRLSVETIKRLENIRGQVNANVRTLNAISEAFEALGIRFESESGAEGVWRRVADEPSARDGAAGPSPTNRQRLIYRGSVTAAGIARLMSPRPPEGLSGFALALDGQLLHVLEGPREAVQRYYGGVASLPPDGPFTVVSSEPILANLFDGWDVCLSRDDPAMAALLEDSTLGGGFQPARLTPVEALGLLVRASARRTGAPSRPGRDPHRVSSA
ncbi:MAG: helix-turn-helix domain-containing protein [Phenylobacterium sp.]|uniref:helix-turn-helix domain-containing protein n=1 Tax=Phenylobacterium sp. TaxID=1871053 RepID=UPI001A60323E|nr:helix-turn-helix domain-containing protein [Phenylobacterium sp.]MBL8770924.1 helix-turn-helix domain-containing protein [Phenylobacterium sp.]